MIHDQPTSAPERVVVAGMQLAQDDPLLFEEDMQEMQMLCDTAGAKVCAVIMQKRQTPEAGTYFGTGKLEEIRQAVVESNAETVVVDAELSPGQMRNIEKRVRVKLIDRSQLILDIFALHATTREARIQVELAQLRTLYPRLTHAWSHFSKQVGGIGTRGPGETQLEVDRRLVQKKITDLRKKLVGIEKARRTRSRGRSALFKMALVGYTNVGKSSLLNRLSGSQELAENKLFATLDTATRRTWFAGAGEIVISDTVGFLRKLPHHLVASFRSTLEVVCEADLLCIVLDASSSWAVQQLQTVNDVLRDLGADSLPRIVVVNKTDLITDPFLHKQHEVQFPSAHAISVKTGKGIEELRAAIAETIVLQRKHKRRQELIAASDTTYHLHPDDPSLLP
jgi:GTP-binding protein HflX